MSGRILLIAALTLGSVNTPVAAPASDGSPPAGTPRQSPAICGVRPSLVVERRYTVKARVRPLLFWTARREVGQAWFVSREADAGRRLELLIGTDPARAPLRINRWGYIAETICDKRAELIGLMTESNEQTVEEAEASATGGPRGHTLKAIRARSSAGDVETEILTVSQPDGVTYQDLDRVLASLPAPRVTKQATVPGDADSGFLVAVTSLIHDSVAAHRESSRAETRLRRTYVYSGRLYDIALRASTAKGSGPVTIEGEFQVRNRATGTTTDFAITYAAAGADAEEATRIVYRPRWWLEIELQREADR